MVSVKTNEPSLRADAAVTQPCFSDSRTTSAADGWLPRLTRAAPGPVKRIPHRLLQLIARRQTAAVIFGIQSQEIAELHVHAVSDAKPFRIRAPGMQWQGIQDFARNSSPTIGGCQQADVRRYTQDNSTEVQCLRLKKK
jgi:hypothetical protein